MVFTVFTAMRNHPRYPRYPRYQHSLEELFLEVFILVDDWLKANQERFRLLQATGVSQPGGQLQPATASYSP
jgi:hypothetical protein